MNPDAFEKEIAADGSVFAVYSSGGQSIVRKLDTAGTLAWEYTTDSGVFQVEPLNDGSVFLETSDGGMLLDNPGQVVWTRDGSGLDFLAAGSSAVILLRDGTIEAIDRSNGQLRWRYDPPGYPYVDKIVVSEAGKVVLLVNDSVIVFDE